MRLSFNLINEPWIPCLLPTGESRLLGIHETLARSHELREILDESPLVTASLHRLLLAILHRVFGPEKLQDWANLWARGRFDGFALGDYLDRWRHRFDLFDPVHPFYQCLDDETQQARETPVTKLTHELSSGNNDTLFDHSFDAGNIAFGPAKVARNLVTMQSYALGGGVSKPFNFSDAPAVRFVLVLLRGASLFQTLMLNMMVYSKTSPFPRTRKDAPRWERDAQPAPTKRLPEGYLDYLTWQSRRLMLIPCEVNAVVARVRLLQGDALAEGARPDDPMSALICRDPQKGFMPFRLRETRIFWRDSHVLLAHSSDRERRPQTLKQLQSVLRRDPSVGRSVSMDIVGACSDQSKVYFWRHERLPLPLAYIQDSVTVQRLRESLLLSDAVEQAVRTAVWRLAHELLDPAEAGGGRKPRREVVEALARSFPCLRSYWSMLDQPFHRLFDKIPVDHDAAQAQWAKVLRRAAYDSFALTADSLDGTARAMRAAVRARQSLEIALVKVLPQAEGVKTHAV